MNFVDIRQAIRLGRSSAGERREIRLGHTWHNLLDLYITSGIALYSLSKPPMATAAGATPMSAAGVPLAVQLIGPAGHEQRLLCFASGLAALFGPMDTPPSCVW